MRKFVLLLTLTMCTARAVLAEEWRFSQSGMAGVYYGITQDRDKNNVRNFPNRTVFRADGKFEALYELLSGIKTGVAANYTVVMRQHDDAYPQGDWRFYPYWLAESDDYGKLTIGYTYNAAYLLHQGAQEISWIGIRDSSLTYWLSGVNWRNGLKSVRLATPKSTYIMDDGRALKFSYFTPLVGNTQFGFSYTPDNANRRGMVSRYARYEKNEDGYAAAMQNRWKLGTGDLYTSAAYGLFNRTDNEWALGARWVVGRFNISASYKKAYVRGDKNPISTEAVNVHLPAYFDNYREGQAWDCSLGYDFGRLKTNLAYLRAEADNTRHRDDLLVQTNRYALNQYWELFLINGYINSKGSDRHSNNNNKGYAVITGLALKY